MGIARSIYEIRGSRHSSEDSELGTEAKLITLANALRFRSTNVNADDLEVKGHFRIRYNQKCGVMENEYV